MAKHKRNLTDVIDSMLEHIPNSEHRFRAVLADLQSSAEYAPPEGMSIWWSRTGEVLGNPLLTDIWRKTVGEIFMGTLPTDNEPSVKAAEL